MSAPAPVFPGAGGPPEIPPLIARGVWDQADHLVMWVRTGSAVIRMADAPELRLAAGEGVWIPAAVGDRWVVETEPGTVLFPLLVDPGVAASSLSAPRRFPVLGAWQDRLIQHFSLMISPLAGRGYSQDVLAGLLRDPAREAEVPVLPRRGGAREVAEELRRNPALDLTVADWAARVSSSPRTLLRAFRADTGLTFEEWRVRCRLDAAVELLADGSGVGSAAVQAGFASTHGLSRAFKKRFGLTPHQFSGSPAARRVRRPAPPRSDDLLGLLHPEGVPDILPAVRTTMHANDVHVLTWMYRGSGSLDFGGQRYERDRGVASWIPAGMEHVTAVHENSISLPLGSASTEDLELPGPLHARFSPAWDDYLLFCAISARTPVRPIDHDPRHVLSLFADQVAAQRALSVPMPTDPRAREAALDYLRRVGASGGSENDLPADIHRVFREQTGMSLSRWRYAARMRIARDLLAGGAKPSAVARRVGYAHLPTFSAAFTRFHDLSPREFQQRETERP